MSFKKELEKRQKAAEEALSADAAAHERRLARMKGRAVELEKHLNGKRIRSVGLDMTRDGARIVLKHDRYQINIDTDVDRYDVAKLVLRQQGAFNLMTAVEQRRVTTIEEVDRFILEMLAAQ
jgi:hypothetical protein